MRILFTSAGARGHSDPLLPIARACSTTGYEVAFSCRPPMAETLEAQGFRAVEGGPAIAVLAEIAPLLPLDREREATDFRDGFAGRGIARQRVPAVVDLCEEWRPDVLVCDETDFGALIAAERLDIPYATVVVIAAGSFIRPDLVAEPLDQLRAEHGLHPDPELEMPTRYLTLVPTPRSFRDPLVSEAPTAHFIRPAVLENLGVGAPESVEASTGTTVYFTLGTVFNMESGDLFERVLTGLRNLPVQVVATVGNELDPAKLPPQGAGVRVERYVPQAEVLGTASVVVSHAGSGTVLGALAFGLPSVLLPMGADQPFNADRCEALGAALVLDAFSCTPRDVSEAVAEVLSVPSYRENAERLRAEILELPEASYAVELLERVAAERRPLRSGS